MDDLQRRHLIPMQRAAFECSARCCDPKTPLPQIQQCADGCQRPMAAAQKVLYGELQAFQERMQRCLARCQDTAQASLPADRAPKENEVQKAQSALLGCMDACAKEHSGAVPKLRGGIEAALKNVRK